MPENIIDFPSCRVPAAPAARQSDEARKATALMHDAREGFIAEWIAWLRHARPGRDDAMMEAEIVGATLRQLATANTTG